MDGLCFRSSLIPVHWSKSPEILSLLNSLHTQNYDTETWFYELLTYVIFLIRESTSGKYTSSTPEVPQFLNSKIISIMEKIYQSMINSIKNNIETDDETLENFEDMLLFECTCSS